MADVNVASIIVTFFPDEESLDRLVEILEPQVSKIFVIDNTPSPPDAIDVVSKCAKVETIRLGKNLGVGAAQNIGINHASKEGFSHILLMDQDSVPSCNMVEILTVHVTRLEQRGLKLAAVGPQLIDTRSEKKRAFSRSRAGTLREIVDSEEGWTPCDYLTSSGSLIPMTVLAAVGGMEEALFVDCVDFEWGYRAASKGYCCVGVFEAKLRQAFGDKPLRLFGIDWVMHSPVRHYYYFRNSYALFKRSYVSVAFKKRVLLGSTLFMLVLSTCSAQKWGHFKMIVRGISHGLQGRLGPVS